MVDTTMIARHPVGRRDFVAGLGAGTIVAAFSGRCATAPAAGVPYAGVQCGKRWFKGNTHMHTVRSDGDAFPAEAAALFKRAGYNFVCFSDHNVTSAEPSADTSYVEIKTFPF